MLCATRGRERRPGAGVLLGCGRVIGWRRATRRAYAAGMPVDVAVACTCGKVSGVVRGVTAANSTRLACMCDDCQVYAHYLGRAAEILDAHGGTDLSYAVQSRVELQAGQELLRAVRLSQAGLLRVYAGCCRTPVAHVPSPQLAFVGIPHLFMRCGTGVAS